MRIVGIITIGITSADANEMTIPGMTCTKASVFKVARLLLLEVIPIHMPNQHIATRFAAETMMAAPEPTRVTARLGTMLRAGAGTRPMDRVATKNDPAKCTASSRITGRLNNRSNARHWPSTISRTLTGAAMSNSISPLRRASMKKREACEADHR